MALVDRASLPEMQADAHVYGFVWLCIFVIEGSLYSKLPTIWRVEKQMKSR